MGDGTRKSWRLGRRQPPQVYDEVFNSSQSAADWCKKSHQNRSASENRDNAKAPGRDLTIRGGQDKETLGRCIQCDNQPEEEKAPSGISVRKGGEKPLQRTPPAA
jgi:hypothetical protein